MRKIIALILVIIILVLSTGALYSCDMLLGNESTDIDHKPSDDNKDIDQEKPDDKAEPNDPEYPNNPEQPDDPEQPDNPERPDDPEKPDNTEKDCAAGKHVDADNSDYCDLCNEYLIVVIDFYALNDLHGKFCDTDSQIGVDELGTYLNNRKTIDDNVVLLATGDMWQGTAESNLTRGFILTEWMNAMGFESMTVGNHDFDWGSGALKDNIEIAEFPVLAINVYSVETGKPVDYCQPSIMIERDGIQIGIIGAIGDCYSSISYDMVEDVYFKVGNELTNLVKAESDRLRSLGADIIVYSLHDGYGSSSSGVSSVSTSSLSGYYSSILSSGGYVDVVFESHTHQSYVLKDSSGVYHLQGGGENKGISHIEFAINSANGSKKVTDAAYIRSSTYSSLPDDDDTEAIEAKYKEIIEYAYSDLGRVSKYQSDEQIESYVASLYLEAGLEKWGNEYDIVLGGGFIRTRSPYDLSAGTVSYADILSLLPFDNRIVLCKISGSKLLDKFINSTSSDYYVSLSDYGNSISISASKTYYVVVDTYTALYSPNGLTMVDFYDDTTFARDLFAEKVKEGVFDTSEGTSNPGNSGDLGGSNGSYTLTTISEALTIGSALSNNTGTSESYYIRGNITSISSTWYGNMYITDDNGNSVYLYGLYDTYGNMYNAMTNKPKVGDTITVCGIIYKYVNGTTTIIELKESTMIQ